MNASTAKIVKWVAAGCGIPLIVAIVCVVCFRDEQPVKKTMAYGQDVYPATVTQTIKATLKRNPDARFSAATVKLGVQNVGMCHQGTQIFEKQKVKLTEDEEQTVQFSVNLLDNASGFFRPAFRIPEGVVVESIEVTDSPAANGEPELTIVEGTILERSAIPDPEKSDYPDCRFTCHFKGNSIVKGKPCPQELSLILEGFTNRKLLGTKNLKPGDRVICIALPFNKLPQEKQTTQQADDLNLASLDSYYAIDIRKIKMFSDMPAEPSSGILFSNVSTDNRHGNIGSKMHFGLDVYPTSSSCVIQATIKNKPNAAFPKSTVEFGIRGTGMCHSALQMLQTETIKRGENLTISMPVNLLDNIGFFQPAFKVPEGIVIDNIEVTESLAANAEPELTIVEGTILECSAIPDPEKSDYPGCRFTCHFKGNSIIKGKPCPQEMSLILEGFADRKLLGTKDIKPGDRVVCIVLPFNKLPQEKQTTQQADDLNLFSLESYYAIDVRKIKEFSDIPGTPSSGIAFTDASNEPYVSVFERHVNPPLKEEFRKAQQEAIAQELQKIEAMLAPYTTEKIEELQKQFAIAWKAEKAKDPPNYNRVVRKDKDGKDKEYVWRNVENSFWTLSVDYRLPNPIKKDAQDCQWPDFKEEPIAPYNLDALIALRDFLEANGCQLLISPVPDFQETAARVIIPEFRMVPDFQTAYMAKQLLKNGIETFYPSKMLIDDFHRYSRCFFVADSHPADTAQDILTDIVAQKLSRYRFSETLNHRDFSFLLADHISKHDYYRSPTNCDIGTKPRDTTYQFRQVLYNDKIFVSSDQESPILIIGNSFVHTPACGAQDSFPALLSSKLNTGIQSYKIGGFGPVTGIVQQLFASPETLLSRKTVIVLVMGTYWFCDPKVYNNIRLMDNYAKNVSGKKNVKTYAIRSNVAINDNKLESLRRSIVQPNFVEILTNESMPLVNAVIDGIDNHKSMTIVIPTYLHPRGFAKYLINGQEVTIPWSHGTYRHLNAFCELPAGADRLKVEIVGKPGTILSIRNIQVYQ